MSRLICSAAVALFALTHVPSAVAETVKCQRAIAKASAWYLQARFKILADCGESLVKSGGNIACPGPTTAAALAKAEANMRAAIGKHCGGDDEVCGDVMANEDSPASVGWPSVCPNLENGSCANPIGDCDDIATCLACVSDAASAQAMSLYYDALELPSNADKALKTCQITIGKAAAALLRDQSRALRKCWNARLVGQHTNDCVPPSLGDGKYLYAIEKAKAKHAARICKACGGADQTCGGLADLTPEAIGFVADCSEVTRPHGGAVCSGPITDLQDIVDCTACVTQYEADCVDLLPVPQYEAYPAECRSGGCTQPAPTGACPATISFTADGANVGLDAGFTGLAHETRVPSNGRLTLAVSNCDSVNHPGCGECDVNGPLDNPGGAPFDNHRCRDASWIRCSGDADCAGASQCFGGAYSGAVCTDASECPGGSCSNAGFVGPCTYVIGAPMPFNVAGVSTCVVNEIDGPVSGTINVDAGTFTTSVPVSSRVHPVGTAFAPCPRCDGGLCQDGPRINQACTVNGTGQFGDVSLDCPPEPGALAGVRGITLDLSTDVQTKTVTAANPTCRQTGYAAFKCQCDSCNNVDHEGCSANTDCPASYGGPGICGGRRCLGGADAGKPCNTCIGGANHGAICTNGTACPGGDCLTGCPGSCTGGGNDGAPCSAGSECPAGTCQLGQCGRPGEPTQPNACMDDSSTPGLDCVDIGGNEGACSAGPVDPVCSTQTFRPCSVDADCAPSVACPECLAGQICIARNRSCFTDNGQVGAAIAVQGNPAVPCGTIATPTVGALFCVPPVDAEAVNAAVGLPGLGRIRIPGTVVIAP